MVVLDASAVPADRGGVGRYVDALVGSLAALGRPPVVLANELDTGVFRGLGAADVVTVAAASRGRAHRLAWEQAGLPGLLRRLGADVLHSPHYTTPWRAPCARVVTLHDATFFTDPGLHLGVKAVTFRAATRHALRHVERCVVPSRATRTELVRLLPIADPDRIAVVPHGVDTARFHPPTPAHVSDFADRIGLVGRSWIAFLGTLEPRKNVSNLVRGWIQAFAERAAVDPAAAPVLVLAGGEGWDTSLEPALDLVPASMTVLRPGYLPLTDLPALLGGAQIVAYPSLGEGFGLPVLEAMATGACVLTTRRLSLPEVGGDAVEYCEPDPTSIAAALRALADDPVRRVSLARQALSRAGRFTWQACAEGHIAAYEAAASSRRPGASIGSRP